MSHFEILHPLHRKKREEVAAGKGKIKAPPPPLNQMCRYITVGHVVHRPHIMEKIVAISNSGTMTMQTCPIK
eukprot:9051620-Ditylum_brightwellii.AAC.1